MCRVRFALPQPTCASAAKGLGQTAGRSSTASRARLRWRSCLESTLRPRREPVRTAARRSARALEGAAPQTPSRHRQGHCTSPISPPSQLPTHLRTHSTRTHTHTTHESLDGASERRRDAQVTQRLSGLVYIVVARTRNLIHLLKNYTPTKNAPSAARPPSLLSALCAASARLSRPAYIPGGPAQQAPSGGGRS